MRHQYSIPTPLQPAGRRLLPATLIVGKQICISEDLRTLFCIIVRFQKCHNTFHIYYSISILADYMFLNVKSSNQYLRSLKIILRTSQIYSCAATVEPPVLLLPDRVAGGRGVGRERGRREVLHKR